MGRLASVSELKSRFYPNYKSPYSRFNEEVQEVVTADAAVLHLGCGADESIGLRTTARMTIGIDIDDWILNNSDVDLGIIGDINYLPLADRSVNIVISRWVMEHLSDPYSSFIEAARVLKPSGTFIVLAPSRYHYSGLITSLTPHHLQKWFVANLLKGDPSGVFPTYYRANTPLRIQSMAKKAGFKIGQIQMIEAAPSLLSFSRVTYLIGVLYEKIVNSNDLFRMFRSAILATFYKS